MTDGAKLVKVAKLGGQVTEFALEDGETAEALVERAGLKGQGEIRINNQPLTRHSGRLSHGDIVTVVPAVKGGSN